MHETHIAGNILKYLAREEDSSQRRIKKICVRLSEFGGISPGHFLEHFREEARGSSWEGLEVEVQKIPYGPELEISRIEFVRRGYLPAGRQVTPPILSFVTLY